MKKFTFNLKITILSCIAMFFVLSSGFIQGEDSRTYIQNVLTRHYDTEGQNVPLKRYEINITNNGFCRYRKVYTNGKEEYFAMNLSRFKDVDFYGSGQKGVLCLRTNSDDVIVQTRNDKAGAIDTMGTYMIIPLKDIDVEELNTLAEHFRNWNRELIASAKKE